MREYAEFGVVLMLFLIGLEMQPRMLWEHARTGCSGSAGCRWR